MPHNFSLIILVQSVVAVIVFLLVRKRHDIRTLPRIAGWSIIVGFFLGVAFDIFSGYLQTHKYILPTTSTTTLCPCGLTFMQLVWNGALSYGLAVFTAYFITPKSVQTERAQRRKLIVFPTMILFVSMFYLFVLPKGTMAVFFACGFAIVSGGELLMLLRGSIGPILETCVTREIRTLSKVWLSVITIAACYEIINSMFPFWEWVPGHASSQSQVELLVIIFAYAGLFHPMIIFWQLFQMNAEKA